MAPVGSATNFQAARLIAIALIEEAATVEWRSRSREERIWRCVCRKEVRLAKTWERLFDGVFSPGIFFSGVIVNLCGCELQALQMNS